MARPRTGTLVPKASGWHARVWVRLADGTQERRWLDLETKDKGSARRKLAKIVAMIAAGELVADARAKAIAPESYRDYTTALHERRSKHVNSARDEQNNRVRYIYPAIGDLQLAKITDDHVRQVLEDAREAGLGWETVRKIRAVMSRDFKRARIEKIITVSPVQDVEIPEGLKKDKRPFTSLTDAEIVQYLAFSKRVSLELKMLSLVARTEGGMRTAELVRWDWSMIDIETFASCTIARAKTGDVQRLEVPDVLRPFLRKWWLDQGSPLVGAVFPVRRGPRKGQHKAARGTSFAQGLRRDLFKAGVVRLPPVDGKPNPADPIYFDTPVSRRCNFHSFRRAYGRALARADVNMQTAMTLASHSDAKTHMLYVNEAEAAKPLPAAALPALSPEAAQAVLSPPVTVREARRLAREERQRDSRYARCDSNTRHSASKGNAGSQNVAQGEAKSGSQRITSASENVEGSAVRQPEKARDGAYSESVGNSGRESWRERAAAAWVRTRGLVA